MGVPPVIIRFNRIFHEINHPLNPGDFLIFHLPGAFLGARALARRAPRGGPGHLPPRRGAGAGAVEGRAAETMGSGLNHGGFKMKELEIHNMWSVGIIIL